MPARLDADFVAVMNIAEIRSELAQQGIQLSTGRPAQLGGLIQTDLARWQKVVNAAGITAD